MGSNHPAVQAVAKYSGSKAAQQLGAVTGSALVRAAVATGNVPGYPASWATHTRHSNQQGSAPMHALQYAVRQVARKAGMGPRANGHGNHAAQATANKGTTAGTVAQANAQQAQANQAAQAKAPKAARKATAKAKRQAAPVVQAKAPAA